MWATFGTTKVSVMKYDASSFCQKPIFSFFLGKNLHLFSSSSKFPILEQDMFTWFWALGFTHSVAPSLDH